MTSLNLHTLDLRNVKSESDSVGNWVKTLKKRANSRALMTKDIPPSPSFSSHKNMAKELIELCKMYKEGLLNIEEFNIAKRRLIYE
tara:strand:+ start:246 stop:503 length:258 start_codon:yes stop_codon:yes gene_type:complete